MKIEEAQLEHINTTLEVLIYRLGDLTAKDISRRGFLEDVLKQATASDNKEECLQNVINLIAVELKHLPISKYAAE